MTKQPLAGVFFDLDGTLIDTAPEFYHIIQEMLAAYNQPNLITYQDFRLSVANGASAMLQTAFQLEKDSDFLNTTLIPTLLKKYSEQPALHSRIFDHLEYLLTFLEQHNILWGVVTNKPQRFTQPLLTAFNLENRSSVTLCPEHVKNTKPHPESLLLACSKTQLSADQCIYIGDHQRDIEAGNRAGMFTIGALYGYTEPNEAVHSWQANAYSSETSELIGIIQNNFTLSQTGKA